MKTIGEILGLEVITEQKEKLGHVIDLCAKPNSEDHKGWQITGLVIGPKGYLERIGLISYIRKRPREKDFIPWEKVVRIREGQIVIAADRATST